MDKKIAFQCVGGSISTNTNDENSDRDLIYVVYPSIEDLFDGRYVNASNVTAEEDTRVVDIRTLLKGLTDTNMDMVSMLFSNSVEECDESISPIFMNKNNIACSNLPRLYNSTAGFAKQFSNKFYKNKEPVTSKSKALYSIHGQGYNTKDVAHVLRITAFLKKYEANGFSDFSEAYVADDVLRKDFLDIKNGALTYSEASDLITKCNMEILNLKNDYKHIDLETIAFTRKVIQNATIINFIK